MARGESPFVALTGQSSSSCSVLSKFSNGIEVHAGVRNHLQQLMRKRRCVLTRVIEVVFSEDICDRLAVFDVIAKISAFAGGVFDDDLHIEPLHVEFQVCSPNPKSVRSVV